MEEALRNDHIEAMTDYIMKHCLWQFHSRSWDRRNQNEGVLAKTTQILCGERVELETPADKCYWVDAVILAEEFKNRFPWLGIGDKAAIKDVMKGLHERMDYLTIDGSLNLELTDQHY
jgi:nitrogenase delta subunit